MLTLFLTFWEHCSCSTLMKISGTSPQISRRYSLISVFAVDRKEAYFVCLKYVMMHPERAFGILVYVAFMTSFPPFDFQVCNCISQWCTPACWVVLAWLAGKLFTNFQRLGNINMSSSIKLYRDSKHTCRLLIGEAFLGIT